MPAGGWYRSESALGERACDLCVVVRAAHLRRTNAQRRFSLLSGSGCMGVSVAVGRNAAPPLSPPQRIDYSERFRFGIAVANRMPSAGERLHGMLQGGTHELDRVAEGVRARVVELGSDARRAAEG